MKAKKFSFHAVLLCIAALFVTLLLLLSSCEESGAGSTGKPDHGKTHIHTFSAEWSSNDTHHWHAASCEHTSEVSDKAGHTFGDWITDQEATEETAGVKHHVCTVCGKTENAEIPKLPHTHKFNTEWSSDGTHHWHAASCEHTNEVSDKAGHTFGDWITDQEATEETAGAKHHVCTVCGKTENAEIPKLPHTHKFNTEWSSNDTHHWHAASCEHTNEVSDKAGHTFGDWITDQEATEETAGVKHHVCTVCGKTENAGIPKLPHTHKFSNDWSGDDIYHWHAASCEHTNIVTDMGKHVFGADDICNICGKAKPIDERTFAYTVENGQATLISYTPLGKISPTLIIPSTLGGYPVVRIGEVAFSNLKNIKEIVLPDSIIAIVKDAFKDCSDLTSITIGNSVTSIGSSAFSGCTGLTSITIPDSVTSIGSSAFSGCTGLTSVTIGNGVTSIGSSAFSGCTGLTSVTIGNGVTSIGDSAFSGCTGLTSITIPDGVTNIGNSAFSSCSGLTSITIGNGVTSIGSRSFIGCTRLTSITIPDSVTSIGSEAFRNCTDLKSITIPDSVTSIGSRSFYGCTRLTSITIPDSVTSIDSEAFEYANLQFNAYDNALYLGNAENPYLVLVKAKNQSISSCVVSEKAKVICNSAFNKCTSLASITIPDSVTSIGGSAFDYSTHLKYIYITDIAAWCKISGLNSLMNYGTDNKNLYLNNELITNLVIPNGVTSIGGSAFRNCTSLTSITIPDSVTRIDYQAFYGCTGLTSITIPDSVTNIGSYAFSGCTGLTSITIPDSVTRIGGSAFRNCTELTSITIPDSVTRIDYNAFYGCTGLTSIAIPDSVTKIGSEAFYGCGSLTSIAIPDSVTSIGSDTFEGTNLQFNAHDNALYLGNAENPYLVLVKAKSQSITSCVISEKAKIICECAFSGCTRLSSVTIPDGVTSIGGSAFRNCTELTSITIPDSVTSIGSSSVFDGTSLQFNAYDNALYLGNAENPYLVLVKAKNQSITSCMISEKTKVICAYAFSSCTELTSITIPDSVTNIGSYAFSRCTGLTSITIPNSVTSISEGAFFVCTGLTSITIPDDVTTIEFRTFYGCTNLTSIIIPDCVTHIDSSAFSGCSNLKSIYYTGTAAQWAKISKGTNIPNDITIVYNYKPTV